MNVGGRIRVDLTLSQYDGVSDARHRVPNKWVGVISQSRGFKVLKFESFAMKILFTSGIFANAAVSCCFLCSILAAPS